MKQIPLDLFRCPGKKRPNPKECPMLGPDRNLPDALSKKVVCIAIDNRDFDGFSKDIVRTVNTVTDEPSIVTCSWDLFVSFLPHMKADLVVGVIPSNLSFDFKKFELALRIFRYKNPKSVVILSHFSPTPSNDKLKTLEQSGLLDRLETETLCFPAVMQLGTQLLSTK